MKENIETEKPAVLPSDSQIEGNRYVCDVTFQNGHVVPLYESLTTHGFNQLLGKAKFINREYGTVFYRGENKLHDSLIPSLLRSKNRAERATERLVSMIRKISADPRLYKNLKLNTNADDKVEAVLQHYGCRTRFLDIVDNHWVSLWMGLNRLNYSKRPNKYYTYVPRMYYNLDYVPTLMMSELSGVSTTASFVNESDFLYFSYSPSPDDSSYSSCPSYSSYLSQASCHRNSPFESEKLTIKEQTFSVKITKDNYRNNKLYLFVLLLAAPTKGGGKRSRNEEGIIENNGIILADLRRCLPSTFLRPHAQHALVIKRRGCTADGTSSFDLSKNLVGIIGVRLDRAADWLGNGKFLTQDNLFPPPMFDHGYDILLRRKDIFNDKDDDFKIAKYV